MSFSTPLKEATISVISRLWHIFTSLFDAVLCYPKLHVPVEEVAVFSNFLLWIFFTKLQQGAAGTRLIVSYPGS